MAKKVYILIRQDNSFNRYGWAATEAWLGADEARKAFDAVPSPAILSTCTLHDADDLVTLGRKLDDANAEIARLRAEIEKLRKFMVEVRTPSQSTIEIQGGFAWLYCHGHRFRLRGDCTEPDEDAHCSYCGVSWCGTGPLYNAPCPVKKP